MADRTYCMCPCCGRSILAEGSQGLFSKETVVRAEEHGGDVWTLRTTSGGRGMIHNESLEADPGEAEEVRMTLRQRCQQFLEKMF